MLSRTPNILISPIIRLKRYHCFIVRTDSFRKRIYHTIRLKIIPILLHKFNIAFVSTKILNNIKIGSITGKTLIL